MFSFYRYAQTLKLQLHRKLSVPIDCNPQQRRNLKTEGGTPTRRKKSRAIAATYSYDYFKEHLEWKRNKEEAKERKKQEQEQIQASKETEIDIYSEEAVTTHLQFVLQKHGLADENFSPAVPFLLNPSFRKIFVHMTEKNQVEWFNDLKKIELTVIFILLCCTLMHETLMLIILVVRCGVGMTVI
nr:uncharacterized protein LOC104100714 [Nicotiana tomentosiformis]